MSTTQQWFPQGLVGVSDGTIDLNTHDIRVLLLNKNYTVDLADKFVDDLTPGTYEHDAGSYSRQALGSEAVTLSGDSLGMKFDAADPVFSSLAAGSADLRYAVIFRFITNDADSRLISIIDFGFDYTPTGNNFTLQFAAEGILELRNRIGPDAVTTVDDDSASAQKVLNVAATTNFAAGDTVLIDHHNTGDGREFGVIDTISAGVSLTLVDNLSNTHLGATGDTVTGWHA